MTVLMPCQIKIFYIPTIKFICFICTCIVFEQPTSKVSIVDEKTGVVSYAANWFPPNSVELVVTLYKVQYFEYTDSTLI